MSEQLFWKYVKAGLEPHGFLQRFEDKLTPGIPDLFYTINGQSGWIELKFSHRDPPSNPRDMLRFAQYNWLRECSKHNEGFCWILGEFDLSCYLYQIINNEHRRGIFQQIKWNGIDFDQLAKFLWRG